MINYICRYIYATKLHNQNTLHPADKLYLPEVTGEYLNAYTGKYQVIPVSVFLMTLYNACFMFQEDKTDNMLKKALDCFNLTPNLNDETFSQHLVSENIEQNIQNLNILPIISNITCCH
jgi:hypothetical protein